jgi:hypothetical protein
MKVLELALSTWVYYSQVSKLTKGGGPEKEEYNDSCLIRLGTNLSVDWYTCRALLVHHYGNPLGYV